jgi:polyisoprenyl-teichoic acid--peptidoglycan teichoic acid transferase
MVTRLRVFFLLILIIPVACSLPAHVGNLPSGPQSSGVNPILVQAPPNSTPTATPFLPLAPTPTYLPTSYPTAIPPTPTEVPPPTEVAAVPPPPTVEPGTTPYMGKTWADYPGPTVWPDIEIPAPVGLLAQPSGQINIVLLGSDQRLNDGGFRTDTILLLTINPSARTANLTSFPRDLYVYIPGWTVQRINTAFQHGGLNSLALTFEYNFGVRPDYYMLINLWSFIEVIDSLGGIDVQVERRLTDQREGHGDYTVNPGTVRMDGETALWYVRSRYTTSDFDRGRRQQEVIKAIFFRMLSLNAVARAPELYNIYKRNVNTNINLELVTQLIPVATELKEPGRMRNFYIRPQDVTQIRNSSGAAVLLPNRAAILEIMKQALNSP